MTTYAYDVPGVAEPLALQPGFWRQHLLQGGVPLKRDGREFQVRLAAGEAATARFQRVLLGFDIPDILVDGTAYAYAPRLPTPLVIWCFLPVTLVLIGGPIPLLIGLLTALANLRVMRTHAPNAMKATASIGLTVAAVAATVLIGNLLTHMLHR